MSWLSCLVGKVCELERDTVPSQYKVAVALSGIFWPRFCTVGGTADFTFWWFDRFLNSFFFVAVNVTFYRFITPIHIKFIIKGDMIYLAVQSVLPAVLQMLILWWYTGKWVSLQRFFSVQIWILGYTETRLTIIVISRSKYFHGLHRNQEFKKIAVAHNWL